MIRIGDRVQTPDGPGTVRWHEKYKHAERYAVQLDHSTEYPWWYFDYEVEARDEMD